MNLNHLLKLFPGAKANDLAHLGEDYFSLPAGQKWVHIPEDAITEREKQLVSQLISPAPVATNLSQNPWAHFLFENAHAVPMAPSNVQVLQVLFKQAEREEPIDQQLWLEAFRQSLPFIHEGFFVTDQYAILVLHNPSHINLTEEIEGILNVLDDDFGVQTILYLGENWTVDEQLPALFAEERQIFLDSRSFLKSGRITQLSQIALPHYTRTASLQSPILKKLKGLFRELEDSYDLILAMWNNQGNVSKAAAELYLHRNTLQYRLDRFLEISGLNLKSMDDLLLCYLAIMARTEGTN